MMQADALGRLESHWRKLSPREQRLAIVTAGLTAFMAVMLVVRGGVGNVRQLDRTIDRLQTDLVTYHRQLAHKQIVEAQYAQVAAQHSSAWTESEIHDRLRQEIYRLAKNVPPSLNADGTPKSTTNKYGDLVSIPKLGEGTLNEGGEGYREYRLNFRIPATEFKTIMMYLERLLDSPQSLRIDELRIVRQPLSTKVETSLWITRTVVVGSTEAPREGEVRLAPEPANILQVDAGQWTAHAGALEPVNGDEEALGAPLTARAGEAGAQFFTVQTLPAGAVYDLFVDLAANGSGSLGISGHATGQPFPESEALRDDERSYRYHLQFTVPGEPGTDTPLRVPVITLDAPGSEARIDGLVLRKTVG